jgi:hypothetical protein
MHVMQKTPSRRTALAGALAAALAGSAAALVWALPQAQAAATPQLAQSALAIPGRGATVPFTEYEAEAAATNGSVLGFSRTADTLASEASGRQAVTLSGTGRYVEFTLSAPANAVDVHYSIPDSGDGSAYTAPLAVYVNGAKNQDLTLTNRYSWFYGSYPFTNSPTNNPHHFYDDVRTMFSSTLAAGTKVRFQVDSGSTSTTIDTADFEQVAAAIGQPAGSLSVTDYGADKTGGADATGAFQNAVNAASSQGKVLYVPQGTYTVTQHVIVNNVTIRGAGPWYSVLHGNGVGIYGNYAPNPSSNVKIYDFAIFGEVTDRNDGAQVNAVGGALGGGSVVSNIWMQHTKVGLWLDGPFDGLTVTGNRILDVTADGLNLHNGISHTTVTQNFLRNTGDDGLAMWSDQNADHDNTFSFNTVELPILANNIAIYGGRDNSVTDNVVSDTQTQGGGLHVANRFSSVPLAGTTTLARNTTLRAGVLDPNWQFGVGALWFDAQNAAMNGTVNVTDTDLLDSSYEAIQWVEGSSITNVNFNNVKIDGTGTFALQLQVNGSASFTNVTAAHVGASNPIYSCLGPSGFTINQGAGNSGWNSQVNSPYCGPWPAPVYTYPGGGGGGGTPTPTPTTPSPTPTTPGPCTPGTGNLALHKAVTASSSTQSYVAANTVDGDANSYWESVNNAFPQTLTVDLCAATSVGSLKLKLPPASAWAARTQTLSVLGSTNGSSFSTLVGSAGYTFDPNSANTVTISFAVTTQRYLQLSFTANTGWAAAQLSEFEVYASGGATPPPAGNLALAKAISASSFTDVYPAAKANDGDANSYWESTNNAFPQTLTLDLGAATSVGRIVLKLPPATSWATRTETLSVLHSSDGSSFTTLVGSAGYTFNPASGNTVTISFPATSTRYLRLSFTANTGWAAGQLSEFEVYAA